MLSIALLSFILSVAHFDADIQAEGVALACSYGAHTVVLDQNGDVLIWGRGCEGEMGNGRKDSLRDPTRVRIPSEPSSGPFFLCCSFLFIFSFSFSLVPHSQGAPINYTQCPLSRRKEEEGGNGGMRGWSHHGTV